MIRDGSCFEIRIVNFRKNSPFWDGLFHVYKGMKGINFSTTKYVEGEEKHPISNNCKVFNTKDELYSILEKLISNKQIGHDTIRIDITTIPQARELINMFYVINDEIRESLRSKYSLDPIYQMNVDFLRNILKSDHFPSSIGAGGYKEPLNFPVPMENANDIGAVFCSVLDENIHSYVSRVTDNILHIEFYHVNKTLNHYVINNVDIRKIDNDFALMFDIEEGFILGLSLSFGSPVQIKDDLFDQWKASGSNFPLYRGYPL